MVTNQLLLFYVLPCLELLFCSILFWSFKNAFLLLFIIIIVMLFLLFFIVVIIDLYIAFGVPTKKKSTKSDSCVFGLCFMTKRYNLSVTFLLVFVGIK
jgi:hypothetical protein